MNRSGRSASNSRGPATPSTSVRRQSARKRGGHIAAIASQEEFDAVFDAVTGGVTGEELKGEWPERLRSWACTAATRRNVAVDDGLRWDDDAPWHEGEPNDWAGSEDCGMICDHIDGGLNDGPCHNTIHCICEGGIEDLVRYDEGQCPEPDWAGWYTLAFLLGFFFWLCAIYGCAGLPRDVLDAQKFRQRLVLGHRALLHPAQCTLGIYRESLATV